MRKLECDGHVRTAITCEVFEGSTQRERTIDMRNMTIMFKKSLRIIKLAQPVLVITYVHIY